MSNDANYLYAVPHKENKSTTQKNQNLEDSCPVIPDRIWVKLEDLGSTAEDIQINNETSNGIVDELCAYIMCSLCY